MLSCAVNFLKNIIFKSSTQTSTRCWRRSHWPCRASHIAKAKQHYSWSMLEKETGSEGSKNVLEEIATFINSFTKKKKNYLHKLRIAPIKEPSTIHVWFLSILWWLLPCHRKGPLLVVVRSSSQFPGSWDKKKRKNLINHCTQSKQFVIELL